MNYPAAPIREAGMEFFGYDDMDEFTRFVRDVCLVLMSFSIGTVVWFMWDRMTGPAEPEEKLAGEPQQQPERAGEPQLRVPGRQPQGGQGEYGSPEEVEARLNAWMREEIIQELRRGEEEERRQREVQRQRELDRQREEIMAELRQEATAAECRRRVAADRVWSRSRGRECATTSPIVHGYIIAMTINSGQCPEVRPWDEDFESVTNAVLEVDF